MKSVLITGATGFAGVHLVELLSKDYKIIALSHDPAIKLSSSLNVSGDIRDQVTIDRLLKKHSPDYIIHLAAKTKDWFDDPRASYDVNLVGTLNLYESVLRQQRLKKYNPKILYISTSEIYGHTTSLSCINEACVLRPANNYATSKAAADLMSFAYAKSQGLNIVIVRPFTHSGPGQQKGFFLTDMASQVAAIEKGKQQPVISVGNLKSVRDYSDVRDIVKAYKLILEAETVPGNVINVCSGVGMKVEDILKRLIKLSDVEVKVKVDKTRFRPVDVPVFIGDNSRLKKLTKWVPEYTLDQTIIDTLNYWRSKTTP